MNIRVIMPTRSRPEKARAVYRSFRRTRALADTELTYVLDIDDPKASQYHLQRPPSVPYISEWSGNMVERTNKEALAIAKLFPDMIIGWCADDNEFITPGWDAKVLAAFEEPRVGFVVTNDNHWRGDKATNVFTRATIVRALGYFALPTQEHLFVDDAWIRLGVASGSLKYLEDVVIAHYNPYNTGVGVPDEQHTFTNRPELYDIDGPKYNEWLSERLAEDAKIVREALS